jgi:excisionase family DNA binding protein
MNGMNKMKKLGPIEPPDPRRNGFASGQETAHFLGVSRAMVTKLCQNGAIPHRRFGRALRIPWVWLLDQVEKTAPPAA